MAFKREEIQSPEDKKVYVRRGKKGRFNTHVNVELESSKYDRLKAEAVRLGTTPGRLIQEWINERLQEPPDSPDMNKDQTTEALRSAGLLVEISPGLRKLADLTIPLEEVQKALSRDKDGLTLSQIVIDGRGPKA